MLTFELKQIFADLTEIDKMECKTDGECHKFSWRHEVGGDPRKMVCVRHYGTVVTTKDGEEMEVKTNLRETPTGKCTLGKISQITL